MVAALWLCLECECKRDRWVFESRILDMASNFRSKAVLALQFSGFLCNLNS